MNVTNLFSFLEQKKKIPIPFAAKLLGGLPIEPEDTKKHVTFDCDIQFPNTLKPIKMLDGLSFYDGLSIYFKGYPGEFEIPKKLKFGGYHKFTLNNCKLYGDFSGVEFLDDQAAIALMNIPNITNLLGLTYLPSTLSLYNCEKFIEFPENFKSKFIHLTDMKNLEYFSSGVETTMSINFRNCSKLTKIGENVHSRWNMTIEECPILELPESLTVENILFVINSPIMKKYSQEELQSRLPNVKQVIYK